MPNEDGVAQFELHKNKLANSLTAVAESMRQCSQMAEQFANIVKQASFSANSPIMKMSQNFDVNGAETPAARKRKASAIEHDEETETGKKKRAPRKPKDPNAPKRPPSAYLLFQNDIRKELKEKNPDLRVAELMHLIGQKWNEMSKKDKEYYYAQVAADKERYTTEKAAYDARSPEEVAAANAAVAAATAAMPPKRTRKVKPKPVAVPEPEEEQEEEEAEPEPESYPSSPVHVIAPSPEASSESDDEEDEDEEDEDDESEEEHAPTPKKSKPLKPSSTKLRRH